MRPTLFQTMLISSLAMGSRLSLAEDAKPDADASLPTVVVTANYNNAVGTSDAASQGVVTSKLIESRPTLRPAEVLEFVPGVIVSATQWRWQGQPVLLARL